MTSVRVNRKAADRIASGHPWIFRSDIIDAARATAGETVNIIGSNGHALGTAHYSASSQIALRLLDKHPGEFDYRPRLQRALQHREQVVRDSQAYRLVHAEADFLPALIVDRYADYLVVQTLNQGMDRDKPAILSALIDLLSPTGIALRNDAPVREREALPLESSIAHGEIPGEVLVRINGLTLHANLLHGQKTGIFLDQRENYLVAAHYAHGKALDCFTSTGGFALHMAKRCESVEAVDSSAAALETARKNASANQIANVEWREQNVFDLLAGYAQAHRHFDTIVLDPPAFAKSRSSLDGAQRGYKEINLRALRLLGPGGILVTCSCSHHVSEAALLEIIAEASLDAGRTLRVLERRTQAQDHPILLTVPETHYLKCLILQVV